jgi:hypothetical protein
MGAWRNPAHVHEKWFIKKMNELVRWWFEGKENGLLSPILEIEKGNDTPALSGIVWTRAAGESVNIQRLVSAVRWWVSPVSLQERPECAGLSLFSRHCQVVLVSRARKGPGGGTICFLPLSAVALKLGPNRRFSHYGEVRMCSVSSVSYNWGVWTPSVSSVQWLWRLSLPPPPPSPSSYHHHPPWVTT